VNRSGSLLLAFALTHLASAAAAQAPSPPAGAGAKAASTTLDASARVQRAQSHFQRGVELYEERDYDGALAEFSRAHELVPNYRVLYNLAQTQVERHDYVDAIRLFSEYLEQGGQEIPAARREATELERESLLARVASVQIESNVDGAELWVGGRSRGVVPREHALRLNAGIAVLRLEKPGHAPVSRQLSIVGGDSVRLRVRLEPSAPGDAGAAAAQREPRAAGGGARTALWLSAGASTLLAGATTTFAVLATRANAELDRELRRYHGDTARLDDTRARVRTHAALADGFGVATLVGLGATLYFALSGAEEEARSAARVRVLVGRSGVGVRTDF